MLGAGKKRINFFLQTFVMLYPFITHIELSKNENKNSCHIHFNLVAKWEMIGLQFVLGTKSGTNNKKVVRRGSTVDEKFQLSLSLASFKELKKNYVNAKYERRFDRSTVIFKDPKEVPKQD